MAATVSDPVSDVVAAVDKLRADDRLITNTGMLLGDVEAIADAITMLQSVLVDRLEEGQKVGATAEHHGRSPKRWLVEIGRASCRERV